MTINEPTIASGDGLRSTWVEVDLTRIGRNFDRIKALAAPAKVMAVVKANAYGHGLAEVACYLASRASTGSEMRRKKENFFTFRPAPIGI